jgi:hypothetical protein
MITRALTAGGDWTYGSGLQNYLRSEAAIEQNIVTTVKSWVGDCYYALSFGVDWYNRLDVGQQKNLVQEIRQVIAGCYGVVGVLSINGVFTGGTRLETITCQIATIFVPANQPASLQIPIPLQGQ